MDRQNISGDHIYYFEYQINLLSGTFWGFCYNLKQLAIALACPLSATMAETNVVFETVHSRKMHVLLTNIDLFIYLGFYVAFNTVQVISRRVVGRAEETSTYSSLGLCTVNCRPTASNYQLSHLRPSRGSNPGLRGGRQECYHSTTVAPLTNIDVVSIIGQKLCMYA